MRRFKPTHPAVLAALPLLMCTLTTTRANAIVNAGVEAGVVKRTAPAPDNMNLGFGYGAHAELTLASTFALGAYYLHSKHSIAGVPSELGAKATFDTLGARGRLILPMPGATKPYISVGLGHSWTTYSSNEGFDIEGESWEVPIGFGIAHQILRIFQLTLEAAYRPSFSFSGTAYDVARVRSPSEGWSALIGFALDL
jgi:opacity protein-like surface antigen